MWAPKDVFEDKGDLTNLWAIDSHTRGSTDKVIYPHIGNQGLISPLGLSYP